MSEPAENPLADNNDMGFLAGGGELGALMRAKDWSATPLGEPARWPRSLKTVVRIMLTSRQPIWIGWGPELIYLYNDAYKSIIGGKHPEALGQPTRTVWREIWGDIAPLLASAMSGDGTFVESQLLIMERNGYPEETYYTFSYSPIPGDDGQPAGIICANSDETKRVIGERQLGLLRDLAASAARARTVSAALDLCCTALGNNPRDVTFSMAFLRGRGQEALQLAAHCACDERLLSAYGEAADAAARHWQADEVLASGEARVVPLDAAFDWPCGAWQGSSCTQAMVLPMTPSADGGREGVLVIGLNPFRLPSADYRDFLVLVAQQVAGAIASADSYELERQRAEQFAELDRAKTEFFSNVSHEFRTPLTLMLAPLGDVLADRRLPESLREPLGLVERNAQRLAKLVNALLEFSRIEAGRHQSSFQPTDLAHLTGDLASNFRSAMTRAGLAFEVQCEPLPEPVYVDRDQWERIVLNLLSNALKFTFTGQVSVQLRAEGEHAVLSVADTGVGVPEHEVGRLFERFHRVEGIHGRTHEGSGIGLALVQELTRLHGGEVAVKSLPGVGTTFTVRIPFGHRHLGRESISEADATAVQARQTGVYVQEALRWLPEAREQGAKAEKAERTAGSPTEAPGQIGARYRSTWGARIVIADDNADLREYLTSLLQPYYRVETVADGEEALAAITRQRPALLLSDVMMPRLDGFGLLAAVREDSGLRTLPVILLSARAGDEARMEGLQAGADDYLIKPFTARELLARVAALIELDRLRRAGEERLRLFLANAQIFTWDVDLATGAMVLSENAAEILGLPPHDVEQAFATLHPDDFARHRALFEDTVRRRSQFTDEVRVLHGQSQQMHWLQIRGSVVCDEEGKALRMSGLSFDITARKSMEEALRVSDQRKDEFLAMLAHELRNPMAPIQHSVELLNRLGMDERAGRAVDVIQRQSRQLTRMVDDLLDVSRITRGRIELERKPVQLAAVLNDGLEAVQPAMRERRHAVSVSADPTLTVIGDAARLQQCLVNLLANAAKYTEPGGRIALSLTQEAGQALITVADNGSGIGPELQPVVFDLFVQSERTLDRAQGGLGIGLSIVRRLVEMHAGTVSVESAGLGQGSTFRIRLPLATAPLRAAEPVPAAADDAVRSARILVIDDNFDAAELLTLNLEMEGHVVQAVTDPGKAVATALDWRPQAVLLDIGMPGMDGYEVARRMRAEAQLEGLRIVALTGYGQADDTQRARAAGFDGHLVKPAAFEDIMAMLGKLGLWDR